MADTVGQLVFKITGDNTGLKKSLNDSEGAAKRTGGVFAGIGSMMKGAMITAAIYGVGRLGKALIMTASDAEETASKFNVVFNGVKTDADAMAKTLGASYGYSRIEAKKMLASTGDILQGFGLTEKKSLDMSMAIQTAATDLASFTNVQGGAKMVSEAMTKALLGEREMLKTYGIAILDADIKTYAESHGMAANAINREQQATITLALIMERMKNATGDFARTQNSFANQLRLAQANVMNLKESLGSGLLPIANVGVTAFNAFAVELDKSAQGFSDWISEAQNARVVGDVLGMIAGYFMAIKTIMQPALDALVDGFSNIARAVKDLFQQSSTGIATFNVLSIAGTALANAMSIVGFAVVTVIKNLGNLIDVGVNAASVLRGMFDKNVGDQEMAARVEKAYASVKKFGSEFVSENQKAFDLVGEMIGDFGKDVEYNAKKAEDAYGKTAKSVSDKVTKALVDAKAQAAALDKIQSKEQKPPGDPFKGYSFATFRGEVDKSKGKIGTLTEAFEMAAKSWKELTSLGTLATINDAVSMLGKNVTDVFGAIDNYQKAVTKSKLVDIDASMNAELAAAGVLEDTAVQKAQKEFDLAKGKDKEEKRRALERAKIEEKYQKQKAKVEYEGAIASWEIQKAMAMVQMLQAPLNAFTSSLATPVIGPYIAPINAAVAAAVAGMQFAAVLKSKPAAPKFAEGGFVPGTQTNGDNVLARVNSGEAVLNASQQKTFMDLANGGAGSGGNLTIYIGDDLLYSGIYNASKDGIVKIHERAVVSK